MACSRRTAALACAAFVVLVVCAPAESSAHEAGTTRVAAAFAHDDTYTIDLTADAAALLARLEHASNLPRSAPATAHELQSGFDALCDTVPIHLSLEFDGVSSPPRARCVVDAATATESDGLNALGVMVTLRGTVPRDARTFRWRYDLTFAAYALTVRAADPGGGETQWLEGGETSVTRPVTRLPAPPSSWRVLSAGFRSGFARILPHGVAQILFLVGLCLMNRRTGPMLWQYGAFGTAQMMAIAWSAWYGGNPPSALVEPAIGLSLVHASIGNVAARGRRGWSVFVPVWGLAHGASLSAVLHGSGLPFPYGAPGVGGFAAGAVVSQLIFVMGARLIAGRGTSARAVRVSVPQPAEPGQRVQDPAVQETHELLRTAHPDEAEDQQYDHRTHEKRRIGVCS